MRRWLMIPGIVLGVLLVAAIGLFLSLPYLDLASFAAGRLAARTGRAARIGTLHLTPGRWLRIELQDAAIANLPGGTRPDMLTVANLVAEVDIFTLLHGPAIVRTLELKGFDLLLEHVGDAPNWRNGPAKPPTPPDYSGLPTLLDATLQAHIEVRSRSGKPFVTTLDSMRITAPDARQTARLSGPGSYQGVTLAADLTFASFDAIRAAPKPVESRVELTSGETKLTFKGTITAPLAMDGAAGELTFDAPTAETAERLFGAPPLPLPPLHLVGTLQRDDPEWHLMNTTGALGKSEIRGGDIDLVEGRPDKLSLSLDFEKLDLDAVLKGQKPEPGASPASLLISRQPGTELDIKLTAASLAYQGTELTEPSLDASLRPGRIEVAAFAFGLLGGQVQGKGAIETPESATRSRTTIDLELESVELQGIRKLLGVGTLPLAGRLDARLDVSGEGATMPETERSLQGGLVATMRGGSIARDVVEKVSTDARTLFRTAPGMVPISCALAIASVRGGVVSLEPLRIRTTAGTIVGRGRLDLPRRAVDLVVASEAATTGSFALDVPMRVTGSLADPSVAPAALTEAGRAQIGAGDTVGRLPPALRDDARRSACLERLR